MLKDARELFPWQSRQKELAKELWRSLDGLGEDAQVQLSLLALASWIFEGTGDDPFSSGLIHCLAVLGSDAETDWLRITKNYSYMLAGVLHYMRVITDKGLTPSAKRKEQGYVD